MARLIQFHIQFEASDDVTDEMLETILSHAQVQVVEPDFDGEGESSIWAMNQIEAVDSYWEEV